VIDAEKANYPIAFMCRLLKVPQSSFYAWANRVETPTRGRRRMLAVEVTKERGLPTDVGVPADHRRAQP
jgi:putative transposase